MLFAEAEDLTFLFFKRMNPSYERIFFQMNYYYFKMDTCMGNYRITDCSTIVCSNNIRKSPNHFIQAQILDDIKTSVGCSPTQYILHPTIYSTHSLLQQYLPIQSLPMPA